MVPPPGLRDVIIIHHLCHHHTASLSSSIFIAFISNLIIAILDFINIILLFETRILLLPSCTRVVEVARTREQRPPKSLDSDENFKPEHTQSCCDLRTFGKTLGQKSLFFGQKQCLFGKKCSITWYILNIILNYIGKFAICAKTTHLSRK